MSKALINSYFSRSKYISNVLKEYNEIKEEIKNTETSVEHTI